MSTHQIFVNLPVADLPAATAFYEALGYSTNPLFSDENATCVVLSKCLYIMLLVKPFFSTFTDKEIIDARTHVQVLNALGLDSREEVDEWAERALAAGGTEPKAAQDLGFMYSRHIADLEGHMWEPMWMDPAAAAGGPGEVPSAV